MVERKLVFTVEAASNLEKIKKNRSKPSLYSQVLKTLSFLEINPKHPSLKTHEYTSIQGKNGEKIWEAYVQNKTPGAYRVFFHYGVDLYEGKRRIPVITIVAITPDP